MTLSLNMVSMANVEAIAGNQTSLVERVTQANAPEMKVVYLRERESNFNIVGLVLDMGSSNIKFGAVNEAGEMVSIWSLPSLGVSIESGTVNLEQYAMSVLGGLKGVFGQEYLNFSQLEFIATVGIVPSLVVQGSGNVNLDNTGFIYSSSDGQNAFSRGSHPLYAERGVLASPASAYEILNSLIDEGEIIPSPEMCLMSLVDYALSFLAEEGLKTPRHVLQYMGLWNTMRQEPLLPDGFSEDNVPSALRANEKIAGQADLGVLKQLGFPDIDAKSVAIINGGTDGPINHALHTCRASVHSTSTLSIETGLPLSRDNDGLIWSLRYGDGEYRSGMALDCGVGASKELAYDGGWGQLLPENADSEMEAAYKQFFARAGEKETTGEYFARLDERLLAWLQKNGLTPQSLKDTRLFLSGADRRGRGPSEAGLYFVTDEGELRQAPMPESPEIFYLLLKLEPALALGRASLTLKRVGAEINEALLVGPAAESAVWQQIIMAVTSQFDIRLVRAEMDGGPLKEPALTALAIEALRAAGHEDAAKKLKETVKFKQLEADPSIEIDAGLIQRLLERYLLAFDNRAGLEMLT